MLLPTVRCRRAPLAAAPFGLPATVLWSYVCASLLFIIGLIKIFHELPQEHGAKKIMLFGRLFFAIPLAVFGSEHFTATAVIARLVPRWIPAHTFWVYLVGIAFLCAALSIVVLVQARWAAALVGMTLLIFVFVMDIPAAVVNPRNRFFWALALKTTCLQRRGFRFRDVAVQHSVETPVAHTAERGTGRHSAILRRHCCASVWGGASAAPGIRAGNPAAKTHSRVDSRANFLELCCWRDSDSRRRLLVRE